MRLLNFALSATAILLLSYLLTSKEALAMAPSDCGSENERVQMGFYTLCGYAFQDDNGNGVWDEGEVFLPDVNFNFQGYLNGFLNKNSSGVTVQEDGAYQIWDARDDGFGNYQASLYRPTDVATLVINFQVPNKFTATTPTSHSATATYFSRAKRFDMGLKPKACRETDNIPTDPKGSQEEAVVAPSILDDQSILLKLVTRTMPGEVMLGILLSREPVANGVRVGFPGLICNLGTFLPVNTSITDRFCRKAEDLPVAAQTPDTDILTKMAQSVILSKRPRQVKPVPMTHDCFLEDIKDATTSGRTKGNQDIDDINTSLGTKQGFYTVDQPPIPTASPDLAENNLSLKQKVFNADKRIPDVNQKCEAYNIAHYPKGVGPCKSSP